MNFKPTATVKRWGMAAIFAATASAWFSLSACDSSTSPGGNDSTEILLTSPKGGETFHVGDIIQIAWTVTGKVDLSGPLNSLDIQLSPDSGKMWIFLPELGGGLPPNSSPFPWAVTDSISYSGLNINLVNKSCIIKVEQYSTSDSNQIAISKPFTILARPQ